MLMLQAGEASIINEVKLSRFVGRNITFELRMNVSLRSSLVTSISLHSAARIQKRPRLVSLFCSSQFRSCLHATLKEKPALAKECKSETKGVGEDEIFYNAGKLSGRWIDIKDSDLDEREKLLVQNLPSRMSARSRTVMKHLLCMSEEDDASILLRKWVRAMKPTRTDWLSILKHLDSLSHPLYFKVTEVAMDNETFEACIRDYTKLMDAYARVKKIEDAERVLRTMEDRGFTLDAITFTVIIQMYGKAGNLDQAKSWFARMRSSGVLLDQKAYGSIIMAYVRAGLPDEGMSLIREMESKDLAAGIEVYKALLQSFTRQGNAEGAQRVFDSIQFACISPNVHTCTLLLEAYVIAGDAKKARNVLENMIKAGLHPDDKCISIMVSAYRQKKLLKVALHMLLKLERDGFDVGPETFKVLIEWLGDLSLFDEAQQILNEMPKTDDSSQVHVSPSGM